MQTLMTGNKGLRTAAVAAVGALVLTLTPGSTAGAASKQAPAKASAACKKAAKTKPGKRVKIKTARTCISQGFSKAGSVRKKMGGTVFGAMTFDYLWGKGAPQMHMRFSGEDVMWFGGDIFMREQGSSWKLLDPDGTVEERRLHREFAEIPVLMRPASLGRVHAGMATRWTATSRTTRIDGQRVRAFTGVVNRRALGPKIKNTKETLTLWVDAEFKLRRLSYTIADKDFRVSSVETFLRYGKPTTVRRPIAPTPTTDPNPTPVPDGDPAAGATH